MASSRRVALLEMSAATNGKDVITESFANRTDVTNYLLDNGSFFNGKGQEIDVDQAVLRADVDDSYSKGRPLKHCPQYIVVKHLSNSDDADEKGLLVRVVLPKKKSNGVNIGLFESSPEITDELVKLVFKATDEELSNVLMVTGVEPFSHAWSAGFKTGDILLEQPPKGRTTNLFLVPHDEKSFDLESSDLHVVARFIPWAATTDGKDNLCSVDVSILSDMAVCPTPKGETISKSKSSTKLCNLFEEKATFGTPTSPKLASKTSTDKKDQSDEGATSKLGQTTEYKAPIFKDIESLKFHLGTPSTKTFFSGGKTYHPRKFTQKSKWPATLSSNDYASPGTPNQPMWHTFSGEKTDFQVDPSELVSLFSNKDEMDKPFVAPVNAQAKQKASDESSNTEVFGSLDKDVENEYKHKIKELEAKVAQLETELNEERNRRIKDSPEDARGVKSGRNCSKKN